MFSSSPLPSTNAKEQGDVFRVYFQYEVKELPKIVENLVNDWKQLAHLYEAALQFATVYKGNNDTTHTKSVLYCPHSAKEHFA